jgi:hypothetical protein
MGRPHVDEGHILTGLRDAIPSRESSGDGPPKRRRILSRAEAEAEGWFNGPPYAVAESVFDEYDLEGCSLEPEKTPE